MIKISLILIFFICLIQFANCQNFSNIGLDDSAALNSTEAALFDSLFIKYRDTFSFKSKKAIFVFGSSSNAIATKGLFFKNYILSALKRGFRPEITMHLLSVDEKKDSGGFDVFILTFGKVVFSKAKRDNIIKKVKEKSM